MIVVDDLVAQYLGGATLVELASRLGIHRRTVAEHLTRREVPIRRGGVDPSRMREATEQGRTWTGRFCGSEGQPRRLRVMRLRDYRASDAVSTLEVFTRAVQVTASHDYSPEQIDAWVGADRSLTDWHGARAASNTQVAEVDGELVGFTDVSSTGYIDMLFVDPAHAREGVASALLDWARASATRSGAKGLSTHASITARPFFEGHGFVTEAERTPILRGVSLTNYRMILPLT